MPQHNAALPRLLQVENLALAVTQTADFSLATFVAMNKSKRPVPGTGS